MGTNFYYRDKTKQLIHIGKRSAAGAYCWDCHITLCKGGDDAVHTNDSDWHTACPVCGKKYKPESLEESATGRELGFNKHKPHVKKGVSSCSSFNWAVSPQDFFLTIRPEHIEDEYGHKYNFKHFVDVLKECPIVYYQSIGADFC